MVRSSPTICRCFFGSNSLQYDLGGLIQTSTNSDAKEFFFSFSRHQNHRKPSNDHPVCIKSGQEQSKNQ